MREISIGDHMKGFCPLGCPDGLVVGPDRFSLMCPSPTCPRPNAVMEILTDTEHIIVIKDGGMYTIRHPLKERLDDELMTCFFQSRLNTYCAFYYLPEPGRYRAIPSDGGWTWTLLDQPKEQADAN